MRKAGDFNEQKKALRFWNYLKAKGVDSSLEEDAGEWTIWVADEDDLQLATEEFNEFDETPDDQKFTTATPLQKPQKEEQDPKPKGPAQGFSEQNLRDRWQKRERSSGVLTMSLLITSVAVYLLSGMGTNKEILKGFYISLQSEGLTEVLNGQFWRLFTPIFLHVSPLNIFFNMYLLHILGNQVEKLKGAKFFITFVLALALFSNLAQFFMNGHEFGGMDGVVYGLFGYVFIKWKLDPGDGFYINPILANIIFGLFLLGFLLVGQADNWAQAGGLLVGLAWGYGSALRWNRGKR